MSKPKRKYLFWRRSIEELERQQNHRGSHSEPVIDTLENKIKEARAIVESGEYKEVIILEIKKVVRRKSPPIMTEEFKGLNPEKPTTLAAIPSEVCDAKAYYSHLTYKDGKPWLK